MATNLNRSVGLRLKAARNAAGLTQEQFAERIDRTKEAISNVERGNNLPTIETLERMCSVLDIKIHDIFKETIGTDRRIDCIAEIDLIISKMTDDDVTIFRDIIRILSAR